jgi:hypothetical protein
MSRFFTPGVESIGPGPSVRAAGDGLEGHYRAILNSVPSGGSCLVVVPALDSLHHLEALCPSNAAGSVGDVVYVGFDDEKTLRVVTPTTHTKEINGVPVPLTGSPWIAPTLLGTWVNSGGSGETVGYFKDPIGFVHLKGIVGGGTSGTTLFSLPAGFRPGATGLYPAGPGNAATSSASSQITAGGSVFIFYTVGGPIGISGTNFLAEN